MIKPKRIAVAIDLTAWDVLKLYAGVTRPLTVQETELIDQCAKGTLGGLGLHADAMRVAKGGAK